MNQHHMIYIYPIFSPGICCSLNLLQTLHIHHIYMPCLITGPISLIPRMRQSNWRFGEKVLADPKLSTLTIRKNTFLKRPSGGEYTNEKKTWKLWNLCFLFKNDMFVEAGTRLWSFEYGKMIVWLEVFGVRFKEIMCFCIVLICPSHAQEDIFPAFLAVKKNWKGFKFPINLTTSERINVILMVLFLAGWHWNHRRNSRNQHFLQECSSMMLKPLAKSL